MIIALAVAFAGAGRPDHDLEKTQEMLKNLRFAMHSLHRVTAPTMIVWGGDDVLVPAAYPTLPDTS